MGAWIVLETRVGGGGKSCQGGGFSWPALLCLGPWEGCAQMRGSWPLHCFSSLVVQGWQKK